jgi:hypothetical protein
MKLTRAALAAAVGAALLAGPLAAQEGMPPAPKPGPEHALLEQDEGAWDATVEMFMAPGAPPMTSKGVETNLMGCGGLCLITDFKGEMGGQPFHGHGTTIWDAHRKKYVGTWTDSMSSGIALGESTYDAASKTMTGTLEGTDAAGKPSKMKSVVEYKDASTRVFTMYMPGPDGKEVAGMRITYKKK